MSDEPVHTALASAATIHRASFLYLRTLLANKMTFSPQVLLIQLLSRQQATFKWLAIKFTKASLINVLRFSAAEIK